MEIKNIYTCGDNRVRAYVINDDGSHKIVSYPRILMEEKLGRPLEPYEDVHHIDENPLNNNIDNLELVMHGEHQSRHAKKYFDKEMICPICKNTFIWTSKQQSEFHATLNRKNRANKLRQPFCSRKCVGLYGRLEQLGRNSQAECELNGETSPNGNAVPITE